MNIERQTQDLQAELSGCILTTEERAQTKTHLAAVLAKDATLGEDMPKDREMRVLICGGRDYRNRDQFFNTMDSLDQQYRVSHVIHGCARGADHQAEVWGTLRNKEMLRFPADWNNLGRAAGMIRNKKMLDEAKPQLVVAFPGGKGTANMVQRARLRNIQVIQIPNE